MGIDHLALFVVAGLMFIGFGPKLAFSDHPTT